jgi:hypothetical protein
MIVRSGRHSILNIVNFTPDRVIELKKRFEVRVRNLEPMDCGCVARELLFKGVVQVLVIHVAFLSTLGRASLIWRNDIDRPPRAAGKQTGPEPHADLSLLRFGTVGEARAEESASNFCAVD